MNIDDLPSPRFILVHSHNAALDANALDRNAHAFGPFDDYSDLVEFDAEMPKDSCYRFAIPLVGPAVGDVAITASGLTIGARPGAMPLPPRTEGASPLATLLRTAYEAMNDDSKKRRKQAKRYAKAAKRAHRAGTE